MTVRVGPVRLTDPVLEKQFTSEAELKALWYVKALPASCFAAFATSIRYMVKVEVSVAATATVQELET